ncbi:hypothetical protein [Streptomyces sp. NBC_01304]|nr:hypothetical protein OG430_33205 [Streptomyces sp. NBC_01304]
MASQIPRLVEELIEHMSSGSLLLTGMLKQPMDTAQAECPRI